MAHGSRCRLICKQHNKAVSTAFRNTVDVKQRLSAELLKKLSKLEQNVEEHTEGVKRVTAAGEYKCYNNLMFS